MVKRLLLVTAAVSLVLTLGAFTLTPTTQHATKGVARGASTLTSSAKSASPQPLCVGSVSATPHTQQIAAGQGAALFIVWHCQGFSHVVININWRDPSDPNHTDFYTCGLFCTDGSTTMGHVYFVDGSFHPHIFVNGSGSGTYDGNTINVVS